MNVLKYLGLKPTLEQVAEVAKAAYAKARSVQAVSYFALAVAAIALFISLI